MFKLKSGVVVGKSSVPSKKDTWVGTSMLFEFQTAEGWVFTIEGRRLLFFRSRREIYVSKEAYDATPVGAQYEMLPGDLGVTEVDAAQANLTSARYEFG